MAIFTNLQAVKSQMRGMFESSRLFSTDIGPIYDALVRDENDEPIEVDNGAPVHIGDFTGNGLQEVYATIAQPKEAIAVIGAPALIKVAFTKEQNQAYHYTNIAGNPAKAYGLDAKGHHDIFAVADYQFTDASAAEIKVGAYVVVDGNGQWVAQAAKPADTAYGFIGQVHSLAADDLGQVTMVRINVLKNEDVQ